VFKCINSKIIKMSWLHKILFFAVLTLIVNSAYASVTPIADTPYASREGGAEYTPMVMSLAAPVADVCADSGKILCTSDSIKEKKEDCQMGNMNFGLECCDATENGKSKYDCEPPCSAVLKAFPNTSLFSKICTELNAEFTDIACLESENTFKYACQCNERFSEDSDPDCNDKGMDYVTDYECKAGPNGKSKYLPESEACVPKACGNVATEFNNAKISKITYDGSKITAIEATNASTCPSIVYASHPNSEDEVLCKMTIETTSYKSYDHIVNACTCPSGYSSLKNIRINKGKDSSYVVAVTFDRSNGGTTLSGDVCFYNALSSPQKRGLTGIPVYDANDGDTGSTSDASWNSYDGKCNNVDTSNANNFYYPTNSTLVKKCTSTEEGKIKQYYNTKGEREKYTDGCPENADTISCAYAFSERFSDNTEGCNDLSKSLYEEVSYCECSGDPCSSPNKIPGGKSCELDGTTYYEHCLPPCKDSDFVPDKKNCKNDNGNTISQQNSDGFQCLDKSKAIENRTPQWQCGCPKSWMTAKECQESGSEAMGIVCDFKSPEVYEICDIKCDSSKHKVVDKEKDCTEATPSGIAISCHDDLQNKDRFMCKCTDDFMTLTEYCSGKGSDCATNFGPAGDICNYDIVDKYNKFTAVCPTDRPTFSSASDCTDGSLDYECLDGGTIKYVCKCPDNWVDKNGKNAKGTQVCSNTEEGAGKTCNYDSLTNLKYEGCKIKCDALPTNGKGITYLQDNEANEQKCKLTLGEGGTFGASQDDPYCSLNHQLKYPCYCGTAFSDTCDLYQNKLPADDALACTIGGTTYYNKCKNNDCSAESNTIAIITDSNPDAHPNNLCKIAGYGAGATGRRCGMGKVECTCDKSIYNSLCKYPLSKPEDENVIWCKYGESGTLMKNGTAHYKNADCNTKEILGKCGEYILNPDGTPNYSVTIHVTPTAPLCISTYGTGATPVLCEYSNDPGRKAYNCWYDESKFTWTESNCPIRHVLGTKFIYKRKIKHYDTCDCHRNYKYHKYNCIGVLSGGACIQPLNEEKYKSDITLQHAVIDGYVSIGQNMQFYGYCKQ